VIESRDYTGFALKAFGELHLGRLDRHGAVEAGVGGAENLTHTAVADFLFNLIRSELLADGNERPVLSKLSMPSHTGRSMNEPGSCRAPSWARIEATAARSSGLARSSSALCWETGSSRAA
jgi:hypothetical protein